MGASPIPKKAGLQGLPAKSKPAIVRAAKRSARRPAGMVPDLSLPKKPDQPKQPCYFLERLPLELRWMIYDILLLSPQKIAISPIRRQQPVDGFICPACSTSHSKKPEPVWRPETAILRTCKQIDFEATRILYRMNDFYLSCPLFKHVPITKFFLYDLRQSTLSQIKSLTFRAGCRCHRWMKVNQKEWKTTGKVLRKALFPHTSFGTMRPSPKRAVEAQVMVLEHLFDNHATLYNPCPECYFRYCAWY